MVILGGGGDKRIIFLFENKSTLSGGDTQILLADKKVELYALSGSEDAKTNWLPGLKMKEI